MRFPKFPAALFASLLLMLAGCDSSAPAPQPAAEGAVASPEASQSVPADPLQPRYASTLAEGIDFKRAGYPEFVAEVAGISGSEDWGRWSDANLAPNARIRFSEPLPQNFTLDLKVRDFFGLNVGKDVTVTAGDQKQTFVLGTGVDQNVQLAFSGVSADAIEIVVPSTSEPTANDSRKMGIGLVALSIKN